MDIHAPHGPANTWREIATHLAIVTVGILIALGLEGLVEWRHHRALVAEARENLNQEIRENRAELEGTLKKLPTTEEQVYNIAVQLADEAQHPTHKDVSLRYEFSDADLTEASWTPRKAPVRWVTWATPT